MALDQEPSLSSERYSEFGNYGVYEQYGSVIATNLELPVGVYGSYEEPIGEFITTGLVLPGDSGSPIFTPSIFGPLAIGNVFATAYFSDGEFNSWVAVPGSSTLEDFPFLYTGPATIGENIESIIYIDSLKSIELGGGPITVNTAVSPEHCPSPSVELSASSFVGPYHLNGNASFKSGVLQLSSLAPNESSSVYWNSPFPVNSPFETHFAFLMSGTPGNNFPPADGFSFIIQNSPEGLSALGGHGEDLGFAGYKPPGYQGQANAIVNSLEVEFNDFYNYPYDPTVSNHVAIMTNGELESECQPNSSIFGCNNYSYGVVDSSNSTSLWGRKLYCWIDYDGQSIKVYLNTEDSKPSELVVTRYVGSLVKLLGNSNYAYAGFAASTGTFYQNTEILSWQPLS